MKDKFLITESLADKISFYHLLVFAMALPFDRLYSELALISLTVHTIIHLQTTDIQRVKISAMLIPGIIYLVTVVGTIYTRFYDEAFYEWERQLAILLFPLIILYNSFDFKKYLPNILFGLATSCVLTLLYLYFMAYSIIRFNHLPLVSLFSNAFLNHNFSAPIDMHATYFSMYIALAAAAMMDAFIKTGSGKTKWLYGGMIFILLAGLWQLSSRAVFISFAVILILGFPLLVFQKRKKILSMLVSVVFSLLVFWVLTQIDNLRTRFMIDLKEDLTSASINNNTLEPRATRWGCAWQLIKQSPIYGHGSGSEVVLLKEVYFQRKLYRSFIGELNAHNEYLSMLMKTGLIGLLALLFVFFTGFKRAVQSKDVVFCAFLVITAVVSFSENILDANKGIFFFAYFFSLFYLGREKEFNIE